MNVGLDSYLDVRLTLPLTLALALTLTLTLALALSRRASTSTSPMLRGSPSWPSLRLSRRRRTRSC